MGFLRNLFGKRESTHSRFSKLFEEMQSDLRTILIPLGFQEKEVSGRARYAEYSRDEFSVWLTFDIMDSICYVSASSNSEVVDDQKNPRLDFSIECSSIKQGDEFKNESITKLKEWLVKQRVR